MHRHAAETFSVKVPDSFTERTGAQEIEGGVEKRTYNGEGDTNLIAIRVTSSPTMSSGVAEQALKLAKEVAASTGGSFKKLAEGESSMAVPGSHEVRFSFTSATGVLSRGVLAYGRVRGRDYRLEILYAAADAAQVEPTLVEAVFESFKSA